MSYKESTKMPNLWYNATAMEVGLAVGEPLIVGVPSGDRNDHSL